MAHTPGPWHWVIHDHSMASLGVGDDPGSGTPLVLSVSPCRACAERADPKEWKWGRCCTPSLENARLIAAAPKLLKLAHEYLAAVKYYASVDDERGDGEGANMKRLTAQMIAAVICEAEGKS